MPQELEGKVAIVTGAGTGIGHAIAQCFGQHGASVCVNYFGGEEQAKELAEKISKACRRSIAVKADVSDSSEVSAMVTRVEKELGPVDILVNNAGVESPAPFLEITEKSWDWMLNVDLKGAFLCAQACARSMQSRGGAIVNISSIH
jgi:NAD(P)-dependent dehydrogenase (short-subunit alcohol dehydrogenase family)